MEVRLPRDLPNKGPQEAWRVSMDDVVDRSSSRDLVLMLLLVARTRIRPSEARSDPQTLRRCSLPERKIAAPPLLL